MFPGLGPSGTTPEGLCFEAIMKEFVPINNDLDSYFLNLSDGQPYFLVKTFTMVVQLLKHILIKWSR